MRGTQALAQLFKGIDGVVIDGTLHLIVRITLGLSGFNQWIDNFFINGGFDRGCGGVRSIGSAMSRVQTGRTQDYLRYVTLGVVVMGVAYFFVLT